MTWVKQGVIFTCQQRWSWSCTHAQVPVVDPLDNGRWRIYYATRNHLNQSVTSFIEVEAGKPEHILYAHEEPVLSLGPLGSFDDCGIMPTSIVEVQGKKYLYYIGWTTRSSVPYHNSVGLAVSEDGIHFSKLGVGPVIGTGVHEPYFTGTCHVRPWQQGYMAYYLSCVGWRQFSKGLEPLYDLKIATSTDGVHWDQSGQVAIGLMEGEGGLASASVIDTKAGYGMWFSARGAEDYRDNPQQGYRIHYAESDDGLTWQRRSHSGLQCSSQGWDSQMVAYPNVIEDAGRRFLFYNGNGFGQSGFGYAIWRKPDAGSERGEGV